MMEDKTEKIDFKKWGWVALIIFIFFIIVGSISEDKEKEPEKNIVQEQVKEDKGESITATEERILEILVDSFKGMAIIEFDRKEKTFYIIATDPSFALESLAALEGKTYAVKSWNEFIEAAELLSENIGNSLPGYGLVVLNPINPENMLLMVEDGVIIYNFLD